LVSGHAIAGKSWLIFTRQLRHVMSSVAVLGLLAGMIVTIGLLPRVQSTARRDADPSTVGIAPAVVSE
jgi:hypothetical protein